MVTAISIGARFYTGLVRTTHPLGGRGRADAVGLPHYFIRLLERCAQIGAWDKGYPVAVGPASGIREKGRGV